MFGLFDGGVPIVFLAVFLINVAFWGAMVVLLFLGIRWLVRQNGGDRYQGGDAAREDAALELLRQRYARGEIDAAEFEERKRTLDA